MTCRRPSRSACADSISGRRPCDRLRAASSSNIVTIATMSNEERARARAAQLSLPPLHEIAARGLGMMLTADLKVPTAFGRKARLEARLSSETHPRADAHRSQQRLISERLGIIRIH